MSLYHVWCLGVKAQEAITGGVMATVLFESFVENFKTAVDAGLFATSTQIMREYKLLRSVIYSGAFKDQKNTGAYEDLLADLKTIKNSVINKQQSQQNNVNINDMPVLEQFEYIGNELNLFKRLMKIVNIDDNKDNKSMLISEIIKLTRSCNQIKSGSNKLSAYKRELRNMLTILGYKTDAKSQDRTKLISKIQFRMAVFKSKAWSNLYGYNIADDFLQICKEIKKIEVPTPEMLDFLKIDIKKLELDKKLEQQTTLLTDKIRNFRHHVGALALDYNYVGEFHSICQEINQLPAPTAEMLDFLNTNIDIIMQKIMKKREEKSADLVRAKIQRFKAHAKDMFSRYDYQKKYDEICHSIDNLENPPHDVYDFKEQGKAIIFVKEQIMVYKNSKSDDFKETYDKIHAEIIKYDLQDIFEKAIKQIYIVHIQNWFSEHVEKNENGDRFQIDEKQAMVVVDEHKNLLVQALAGSGKTGTVIAKIIYLVAICKVSPSEIIAFAFNRDAADEINARLKKVKVNGQNIVTDDIATTFHALAYRRTEHAKILIDERNAFVQDIIKQEISKEEIYELFRKEATQINDEKTYQELRYQKYKTLGNQDVKSRAEKFIADFLFEHGIPYRYEPCVYINNVLNISFPEYKDFLNEKKEVKPDFVLTNQKIVWEHWGISGHEMSNEIEQINKKGVIGSYEAYKANMDWKRKFYRREWLDPQKEANEYASYVKEWTDFIETSYEPGLSREDFEQQIKTLLNSKGIKTEMLSRAELVDKVAEKQINNFTELVVQFIDRVENNYINELDVLLGKIRQCPDGGRERIFLDIALRVYNSYCKKLEEDPVYDMDFNMLMNKATADIIANPDNFADIAKKRFVFIDEFQDFTKLFYGFIQSIRSINKTCRMVCVGDEYQAINRFAGSDIKYFKHFKEFFGTDSKKLMLSTNYRSNNDIVKAGCDFLRMHFDENIDFTSTKAGQNSVCCTDISRKKPSGSKENRYLEQVVQIISDNKTKGSITILHRNRKLSFMTKSSDIHGERSHRKELHEFLALVRNECVKKNIMSEQDFSEKVTIDTIHKSKGLEADVVIFLETDTDVISSIHPNLSLFSIFGDTPEIVMADEKRLFYVAITRAKEQLWLLYDGDENKSDFLNGLPLSKKE